MHKMALYHLMKYVNSTADRGLEIFPERTWDGKSVIKLRFTGKSDSDDAANMDDRCCISGGVVFIEGYPAVNRSAAHKFVTLSVMEAEMAAGVIVAQDILYCAWLVKSIGLEVEYLMVLEMDDKEAVDLAHSWSMGRSTQHVDVRNNFLREMKKNGHIVVKNIAGDVNEADIFIKNATAAVLKKHIPKFVGQDKYIGDRHLSFKDENSHTT